MHVPAMPGHLIRRMQQTAVQIFARRIRSAGIDLTPVQFAAMDAIRSHPGADQVRVATLIGFDKATIGGVVARLEAKGLVQREVSARDRRARNLRLTAVGEATFACMLPLVEAVQDEILSPLSAEDRAAFLSLAARLIDRTED